MKQRIKLTEQYLIDYDGDLNWSLIEIIPAHICDHGKHKGNTIPERDSAISHHATPEDALKAAARLLAASEECETIQDYLKQMDAITARLVVLLKK